MTIMRTATRIATIAFMIAAAWLFEAPRLASQPRAPVTLTRLFTGTDGLTHAEQIPMRLELNPAFPGTERSDRIDVRAMQILRWPAGTVNEWHNASQTPGGHQYVMTLSGRGEVELSDGTRIALVRGQVLLAEDLTGKGHITRTVGSEDWVSVHVSIADSPR
jgi:hypothetical protein